MNKYWLLLGVVALLLSSCGDKKDKKESVTPEVEVILPDFNADSAFHFVQAQTEFGPRVPNGDAHAQCAVFLTQTLKLYCDTFYVQEYIATTYNGIKLRAKNMIGSFNPDHEKRIFLAAHWDSRPYADHDPDRANHEKPIDGANDGASGVGVLLEIARQLAIKNPNIGVDIIFFDAEDWGPPTGSNLNGDWWCLGSQHWAQNPHLESYRAEYGILLDMVGASDAKFYHEGYSSHYAQSIVSKIWGTAHRLGFSNLFINQPGNPIIDDHLYVNQIAKIPTVNIVHQDNHTGTGFNHTWHTLMDNISNIDKNSLDKVGKTVLAVIYSEE